MRAAKHTQLMSPLLFAIWKLKITCILIRLNSQNRPELTKPLRALITRITLLSMMCGSWCPSGSLSLWPTMSQNPLFPSSRSIANIISTILSLRNFSTTRTGMWFAARRRKHGQWRVWAEEGMGVLWRSNVRRGSCAWLIWRPYFRTTDSWNYAARAMSATSGKYPSEKLCDSNILICEYA